MIRTKNMIHPGEILLEEFLKPMEIAQKGNRLHSYEGFRMTAQRPYHGTPIAGHGFHFLEFEAIDPAGPFTATNRFSLTHNNFKTLHLQKG